MSKDGAKNLSPIHSRQRLKFGLGQTEGWFVICGRWFGRLTSRNRTIIRTPDPLEPIPLSSLWNLGNITTISARNMDYSTKEEIETKISDAVAEGLRLAMEW